MIRGLQAGNERRPHPYEWETTHPPPFRHQSFNFANNLLRFADPGGNFSNDPLYDFEDVNRYQNNILNGEADFKDVNENQLFIGAASDVISKGNVPAAQKVPFDILGVNRITSPDIGAYQHIIFQE